MKRILLTGATSFLGKYLLKTLKQQYEVITWANHDDQALGILKVDLTDGIPRIEDVDAVIHAGALVDLSRDFIVGKKCIEINTFGTMHILEAIKNTKPLFLYISSEEVYGNGPIPFDENQRPDPPSPYAISKLAGEHLALWYGKEYDFPVVIARLGTFYGPGQPEHKYFAQTILRALRNESIPCNSGQKKRDYLYINDAIDLIHKILEQKQHGIINGAGGKAYRLLDVIETVIRLTNSTSEVKIGEIPDRITEREEWLCDITLAKELYQWEPKVDLEEGLRRTVEYFRNVINYEKN